MGELSQGNKADNEISIRLLECLKSIGYDVEKKGEVPRLQEALKYDRPQNIYNAISKKREPGLQILTDLSNKFENFDINYVLTGRKKATDIKEEDTLNEKTASTGEMAAMFNVLVDYLKDIQSNLHSTKGVTLQNHALIQASLLQQAQSSASSAQDAEQAFAGSLEIARQFLKQSSGHTDVGRLERAAI